MWFIAVLLVLVTTVGGPNLLVVEWIYRVVAVMLLAMAGLTALTGARSSVIWFKVCVVLLSVAATLLLVASVV